MSSSLPSFPISASTCFAVRRIPPRNLIMNSPRTVSLCFLFTKPHPIRQDRACSVTLLLLSHILTFPLRILSSPPCPNQLCVCTTHTLLFVKIRAVKCDPLVITATSDLAAQVLQILNLILLSLLCFFSRSHQATSSMPVFDTARTKAVEGGSKRFRPRTARTNGRAMHAEDCHQESRTTRETSANDENSGTHSQKG